MARKPKHEPAESQPEEPVSAHPSEAVEPLEPAAQAEQKRFAPNPHYFLSIALSDSNDGPHMRLGRSNRWQQMTMQFTEKPSVPHIKILQADGWKWRSEMKAWTKQLDKEARWKTQVDAERLFHEIANEIRAANGLEPTQNLGA